MQRAAFQTSLSEPKRYGLTTKIQYDSAWSDLGSDLLKISNSKHSDLHMQVFQHSLSQVKTLSSTSASSAQPEVTQLALSPDGKQLAAGYADGTLRLWDVEAAESEHPASGHRSGVSALCYSQNGALLASGGQDTDVVVWDVTSGTPLYRLQGHLGQITALVS